MAHSENIISSIKLPNGTTYEVHDANAIHDVSELGLSAALVFKGTKATVADLPTTGNKVGDVWLVTETNGEYVWTDESKWEPFGSVFDAASSDHIHTLNVEARNYASEVTGHVVVPTITATQRYLYVTSNNPTTKTTTDSVLGADTTFSVSGGTASTTKLKATASGTAVGANGTAKAITALGTPTTETAITGLNTATAVNASVTNGVLTLTPVTVATGAKSTASAITSLGTPTTTDVLTGVKVTSQPTVTLSSGSTGDVSVATGVSAISVTASGDAVDAVTGVDVYAPEYTIASTAEFHDTTTPAITSVTIGTANSSIVNGVAKAQVWEMDRGTTNPPSK